MSRIPSYCLPHSLLHPERKKLWENSSVFQEYHQLKRKAETARRNAHYESPDYIAFETWNPIFSNKERDFDDLEKRFQPTVLNRQGSLCKINKIDFITASFLSNVEIKEEVVTPSLKERFITFHKAPDPTTFSPTIQQVFMQLPLHLVENSTTDYYFNTEILFHSNYFEALVGLNKEYHVAITSIYSS